MIDEAKRQEILAKHPEAEVLTVGVHEIVVRVPGRAEYRRFKTLALDERRRVDAAETLVRDCCLYPDGNWLNDLLERQPALAEVFGGKLLELAGMSQEVAVRDLSGA